jgi:hypothetical protein
MEKGHTASSDEAEILSWGVVIIMITVIINMTGA